MAGSLNHLVGRDGRFRMDLIENLRDAREALEECFQVIYCLSSGDRIRVNGILKACRFPTLKRDMKLGESTDSELT